MNINPYCKMNMDFNMKKIVKDAGAALSRVVQVYYHHWSQKLF